MIDDVFLGRPPPHIEEWLVKNTTPTVVYHTVTFDPTVNGQLPNPSDAIRQVADGQVVGTLPEVYPTHAFSGWYTEQNGLGTKVTESTVITSDITFYAFLERG